MRRSNTYRFPKASKLRSIAEETGIEAGKLWLRKPGRRQRRQRRWSPRNPFRHTREPYASAIKHPEVVAGIILFLFLFHNTQPHPFYNVLLGK
jgi:hypothetical protein